MSGKDHGWTHVAGGTDPIPGLGGAGEWCRLGVSADYTIQGGVRHFVEWDMALNPYPSVFTTPTLAGMYAIQPQVDGVYAATFSLYLDVFTPSLPDSPVVWIGLQHTTWTVEEEAFAFPVADFIDYPLASPILTGSKVFRSGPTYDPVYMAVSTKTGSSDFDVIGDDYNITYLELVRLTSADKVGDPYDFD